MNKKEFRDKLLELKGGIQDNDESNAIRIVHILDLIELLSEDSVSNLKSMISFERILNSPSSALNNYSGILQSILDELREKVNLNRERERNCVQIIKTSAIRQMRDKSKGKILAVIFLLGTLAGVAIVFGILAAANVIGEWGSKAVDLIGVFDCVAGLIFFSYEFYNDKVNEGKVNDDDFETVKKYLSKDEIADIYKTTIKTGDIIGNTGVAVTGRSGFIINTHIQSDNALEEVEKMFNKYHKN